MVHTVEELGDVPVHHPVLARLGVALRCTHRGGGTFPRPEAKAAGTEGGVEAGWQRLQKHWLYPAVEPRREAQQPQAPVGLGNLHPPPRTGNIRPGQELGAEGFPVLPPGVAPLLGRPAGDARRASVAFDRPPGGGGIVWRDDLFHQLFVQGFLW